MSALKTIAPLLALIAVAPMAAAQEAARPCADESLTALAPASIEEWLQSAVRAQSGAIEGPSAQGPCTAECWDGSSVTCDGSSCSAENSNCSGGVDGYCEGSDSGRIDCPPCPCSAQVTCEDGTIVSCEGTGAWSCRAAEPCYVECDGQRHWCPSPLPSSCPQFN